MATYVGKPLKRFEDPRLVTGQGSFVDDLKLPGMLHAMVLRSPHAHARVLSLDTAAARALPQVLHGDTAMLASGQGTFASRGMTLGGSAMYEGLQQARQKMTLLAAHLLDCRPEDIVFQDGKLLHESRPER